MDDLIGKLKPGDGGMPFRHTVSPTVVVKLRQNRNRKRAIVKLSVKLDKMLRERRYAQTLRTLDLTPDPKPHMK